MTNTRDSRETCSLTLKKELAGETTAEDLEKEFTFDVALTGAGISGSQVFGMTEFTGGGTTVTLRGGEQHYRRVLLGRSTPHTGPFAGLYGSGTIELVQALDRTPRKIYEGRYWGDPGFIQICFDVVNMRELEKYCQEKGYPFTVDSCANQSQFDMGLAAGHFTYIEDPDGTLIEMVEIHKIPIINKPNISINLMKRDRTKQLPTLLFRMMKLNKVKFKDNG